MRFDQTEKIKIQKGKSVPLRIREHRTAASNKESSVDAGVWARFAFTEM